ncbi:MAG: Eco57I restriction-modification methylase domain-containing protein [Candidatus Promineofilum sp.]|nr:Eco57I restriction-modification methylase domain-containing protein [Promineifilum sp.]
MSDAQQLSLDLGKPHRNHGLFSDHYLEEILRRDPAWAAAQPRAAALLAFLRDLHAREAAQLPAYSEAQLEERWLKPILGQLGHVWESQATVPGLEGAIKKPDYVFFADEATRMAAVAAQRSDEYARRALAVGEVKAWPVNLSRRVANAPTFDNSNPMFQIDYYLKSTGVAWGIISNGRLWRLVQRDSSHRLDAYFELDLLDALNAADEKAALAVANYFVVFFGQPAFRPGDDGAVFLDEVLRGSRTYAVALESDLRDNAYKALEQLITGFFAPAANGLDANSPADRDAVYRNSLLLLYRLLFLFYGESRGLLPMRNPAYAERSLSALARAAAVRVDNHTVDALPATASGRWGQLNELFTVINGDDAALNASLGVPRYNGGLFDPQRHPFLAQKFVGEQHLVRALDYLARRRKTDNGRDLGYEAVDYRTLGVRQLGSIYEGLLEYRVSLAVEPMVTVRKGGKETWLPARERGQAKSIETRQPGQLYLATDKGERKATGSYYTPDTIVKYIVEQTLGPLVEEAWKQATRGEGRGASEEKTAAVGRRFAAGVLALNVLDPAMGSGHFLVEATNFLARALVERAVAGPADDPPLATGHPSASEDADSATVNNVLAPRHAPPATAESEITTWRRRVVEACIYGVDKNELAVELAKLSLWLETAAADKPLSFLDHHLRHGDSLIGAWLRDLDKAPSPSGRGLGRGRGGAGGPESRGAEEMLFDESAFTTNAGQAVGGAAAIEAMLTEDLEAVHAKERIFRDFHDNTLGRWRRLADVWVSAYFGNAMSAAEYADLARRIQGRPATLSDEQAARYLAHPAVVANDYFHWELEFPEVFFDKYGRPKGDGAGFDAVIGNPPYVSAWSMTTHDREVRSVIEALAEDPRVLGAHWDLYIPFLLRAFNVCRSMSFFSFILPNPFSREKYAVEMRRFLLENSCITRLLSFGEANVFDEVSRQTLVLVVQKAVPDLTTAIISVDSGEVLAEGKHISPLRYTVQQSLFYGLPGSQLRHEASSAHFELLQRMDKVSIRLGNICYVNYGAQVSSKQPGAYVKADVVSEVPFGNSKRFFEGRDLDRYFVGWGGLHLDYRPDTMYGPRSEELFKSPKLVFRKISGPSDTLLVGFDDQGYYCDDGLVLAVHYASVKGGKLREEFEGFDLTRDPYALEYCLALSASKLMSFYYGFRFATGSLQGSYSISSTRKKPANL